MISKIYYINLDRRPDRDEHINSELKKINFEGPIERIDAIDGRKTNINNLPNSLITDEGKYDAQDKNKGMYYILTPGAVGCALSHLKTYNKIIEEMKNDEHALILEDDITIDNNFMNKLNNYTNKIPKFDILFLGYHNYSDSIEHDDYGVLGKIWGLFGYIINKKAAIEIKKVFPLRYQIDTEMPKIFKNLNVFYLKEKLILSDVSQNTNSLFPTDTQTRELFNNIDNNEYYIYIILLFIILLLLVKY
jgi:GR25 family glycosyltransferase involved in LPS biosynthesis